MPVDNEPTDNQINYARSLGIYVPFGITFDELSDLISNIENNDKSASDRHKTFADFYNIKYSKNVGKKMLFERIQYEIFSNNLEQQMASWFVFRVYRSLVRGQENVSISMPSDRIIEEITNTLLNEPKFKTSLKRYADQDLRFFGEFTASNGITYFGASKTTNSYKLASAELKKHIQIQKDIEKGWNSPRNNHSGKSDSTNEAFEKKLERWSKKVETWSENLSKKSKENNKKASDDIDSMKESFKNFKNGIPSLRSLMNNSEKNQNNKSLAIAYTLLFLLGLIGGHRFYLGRKISGALFVILFMISITFPPLILIPFFWLIIDIFFLPRMVKNNNFEWF